MIFLTYIYDLTAVGPIVSEITCLIKIDTDDRQTETGDLFFQTLGVMKRRENMKAAICSMEPITILPRLNTRSKF